MMPVEDDMLFHIIGFRVAVQHSDILREVR